nr:hypothetical protein CFP56_20282 [Quercus suber]
MGSPCPRRPPTVICLPLCFLNCLPNRPHFRFVLSLSSAFPSQILVLCAMDIVSLSLFNFILAASNHSIQELSQHLSHDCPCLQQKTVCIILLLLTMSSLRSVTVNSPTIDPETAIPLMKGILAKLDLHYTMYPGTRPKDSASGQPPSILQQAESILQELDTPVKMPAPALPSPPSTCQQLVPKTGSKRKACDTVEIQNDQCAKLRRLNDTVQTARTVVEDKKGAKNNATKCRSCISAEIVSPASGQCELLGARASTSPTQFSPGVQSTGTHNLLVDESLVADVIDPCPTHARIDSTARRIVYGTRDHQQTGWLRTALTVSRDDHNSSLVRYNATVFLKNSNHANPRYVAIGELSSYRILKTESALSYPFIDWRTSLLQRPLPIEDNISLEETVLGMRALFERKNGLPRQNLGPHVDALKDSDVMFISGVLIYPTHQQLGLLRHGMEDFETLLTQLPATSAFTGPLVLVPAPLLDYDRHWRADVRGPRGRLDDSKVIQCLTRTYEKCGFAMWVKEQRVGHGLCEVMGKLITSSGAGAEGQKNSVLVFEAAEEPSRCPSPKPPRKKRSLKSLADINRQKAAAAEAAVRKQMSSLPSSPPPPLLPEPTKKKRSLKSLKEINQMKAATAEAVASKETLPKTAEHRMVSVAVKEEFGLRTRRR